MTYPNPDRVGRCEFAAKTILGLAFLVPCLVLIPREGTSLWYKVAALVAVSFALYMSILWMFLNAKRLHDIGRTGWWILGFIVFQNIARNLARTAPKGLALEATFEFTEDEGKTRRNTFRLTGFSIFSYRPFSFA